MHHIKEHLPKNKLARIAVIHVVIVALVLHLHVVLH